MTFTDDANSGRVFSDADLKRLKEGLRLFPKTVTPDIGLNKDQFDALLARLESAEAERDALKREREQTLVRLEAAEAAAEYGYQHLGNLGVFQNWRKACGK